MKSKFHKITLALVASILVFFLVNESSAALQYIVTDLGDGIAFDINNNGQVVGTWEHPQGGGESFYWDSIRGRENIDLGGSGGFLGINDVGEAIQNNLGGHPPKGRIWNSITEVVKDIPVFPKAINDSAYVTGWTGGGPGGGNLAVVWDDTNGIQPVAGGINGIGYDVNDYGEVVGEYSIDGQQYGFIWDSSNGLRNIPTLGGDRAEALAINNLGQVVGVSEFSLTSTKSHAFLWDEFNGNRDLGTLESCPAETDHSTAHGINILGQVVGRSCAISVERPNGVNAVIWDETNGMIDLNTLIPVDSGWILETASAINDSGQIVGWGTLNGEEQCAFLLTPLSAPIPHIVVSPLGYNFERVVVDHPSDPLSITIYNYGDVDLLVSDMSLSDDINFFLDGDTIATIEPGGSHVVIVTFSPQSMGEHDVTLSITSNAPLKPNVNVRLIGEGEAAIWGCINYKGSPLGGLEVSLMEKGGKNQTAITDSDGCYRFERVGDKGCKMKFDFPLISP
jgi:probable HAF family extracellular repeat protein